MTKRVLLANPRGFCAGVDRAIEIVNRALDKFGAPVYVRHEVVHNRFVVDSLREKGAVFVENLDDVPEKCIVIFSAHGVSAVVKNAAAQRHLSVFDATCPLVTKVHMEVVQHAKAGRDVVLIGHRGHPEVEGTLGQWDDELAQGRIYLVESVADAQQLQAAQPENIAYVSQTTLSVDDTREVIEALVTRFPSIRGPKRDDICYATQNRQNAVRALSEQCDLVLVVGSPNSSNSNRLCELAVKHGVPAHLIEDESHIKPQWLDSANVIGVTAGASAPEELVQNVLRTLHRLGVQTVKELEGDEETIIFSVPRTLK